MRSTRIALLLAALAAAGCGSSSNDSGPTELTGTVRGLPFTVVEAAFAGPETSNDCSIDFQGSPTPVPYAPSSVLIGFSKSPGLCQTLTTPCAMKKSFGLVGGLLVHARISLTGAPVAPPLDAASYPVVTDLGSLSPDTTGAVRVGMLSAEETDDACLDKASIGATGTATISAISANEIRGSLDLTFEDGGKLAGPFVATRCDVTYDACTPEPPICNGTPTCN